MSLIRIALAGCGALLGAAVLLVTVVSLGPGHSRAQEQVGYLWTNYGPRLAVLSAVAAVVACWAAPAGRARLVVAVVTGLALLGATTQVGRVVAATVRAGGSVNLLSALALSPDRSRDPDAWAVYHRVDGQDLRVAIWLPAGARATAARPSPASRAEAWSPTGAPVMFAIHGGGWIDGNGTAADYGPEAAWWTARGWLFVSVDYRLSSPARATWDKSPADVACALTWTAAAVARYGGDPSTIVVRGDSAGGNLAINLAYSAAQHAAISVCAGPVPVPRAVVAFAPVVDPENAYDHGVPQPGADPKVFIGNYLGGPPRQFPDRIRSISSATYLSAAAPPTLIIEPVEDGFIPSEAVFAFAAEARAAGVTMTLVRIPTTNHFPVYAESPAGQADRTITAAYLKDLLGQS
ncbi:alpha/beta hydrolase [Actinoplanes sp. KI2]|uniref:alpha/beta hydrolase n=1 Tax=Actinoplanes sp. KI2 TaxID=2983315 RepID=UPI0021D5D69B|nr:alpha/beta hydrolase [Actinoplanes sp. KI2]MCU7726918.1 alpha/beta hydrolase [Actinoplanes sp. KI2]